MSEEEISWPIRIGITIILFGLYGLMGTLEIGL